LLNVFFHNYEMWNAIQRKISRFLLICALVGVYFTGTSATAAEGWSFALEVHRGDTSRVDLALEDAVFAFLGGQSGLGSGSGSGGSTGGGLSVDTLTNRSGSTPVDRGTSRTLAFRLGYEFWKTRHVAAELSATAGRTHSKYALPRGAGVLTDPIQVKFASNILDLETALTWNVVARWRYTPRLRIAGGVRLAHTKTQLNSALLRVRNSSTHRDPYLSLGLQQPLPLPYADQHRGTLLLDARVRGYDKDRFAYQLGLVLQF
jgi:hypothetical protein